MYQPTSFQVVTGEKLKEWERNLRERVGLQGDFRFSEASSCTACACADIGEDDCDQD
jgi:hypothetical protein